MEDVLQVYHLPYDPDYPQVCMDETCKQLIGEVQAPMVCAPGRPARVDHEYVRNGVVQIFLEVEPLTGKRHVAAMEHRTRKDWAWWIKGMLDERYPNAVRVRLPLAEGLDISSPVDGETPGAYTPALPALARTISEDDCVSLHLTLLPRQLSGNGQQLPFFPDAVLIYVSIIYPI